jgi:hypothetical protein
MIEVFFWIGYIFVVTFVLLWLIEQANKGDW